MFHGSSSEAGSAGLGQALLALRTLFELVLWGWSHSNLIFYPTLNSALSPVPGRQRHLLESFHRLQSTRDNPSVQYTPTFSPWTK